MNPATSLEAPQPDERTLEIEAARFTLSARLIDSMLHDVRNPLNAMAIHLDVLTEKLKVEGQVPPNQEKNLKSIRDQVFRVDALLRQYADFLSNRSHGDASFSEVVQNAVMVVGHEVRKAQLTVRPAIESEVRLPGRAVPSLAFLAGQTLMRAIARVQTGSELQVSVFREGGKVVFRVRDDVDRPLEPAHDSRMRALAGVAQALDGELDVTPGELTVRFPTAPAAV